MSFEIQIADSDVRFACAPDQTVLDAALKAGIELPYSCRKGVCGNCAAQVRQGAVAHVGAGNAYALPPGQELLCQSRPLQDLEIVATQWRRADPGARKRLKARVFRNMQAAPDVCVLQLRLPAGQRVKFRAGQYLQVLLPDGSRRSYSMANPPHESDGLQLHVRLIEGGEFSRIAAGLQAGDELELELPFGQVMLDLDAQSPLVCVCGGTGFAPVKSLLDDLAKRKSSRPVTLVWGSRDADGLYLRANLDKWIRSLPNFRAVFAIESPQDARTMNAVCGRVDDALCSASIDLTGADVYCCGAPAMVSAVRAVCVHTKGLPLQRFHSDAFVVGPAA